MSTHTRLIGGMRKLWRDRGGQCRRRRVRPRWPPHLHTNPEHARETSISSSYDRTSIKLAPPCRRSCCCCLGSLNPSSSVTHARAAAVAVYLRERREGFPYSELSSLRCSCVWLWNLSLRGYTGRSSVYIYVEPRSRWVHVCA